MTRFSRIQRFKRLHPCLLLLFLLGLGVELAVADRSANYQQELEQIRAQLGELTEQEIRSNQERTEIIRALADVEKNTASLTQQIRETQDQYTLVDTQIKKLEIENQQLSERLDEELERFTLIMRVHATTPDTNYIKLLLSGERRSQISHNLFYYRQLTKYQADQVTTLKTVLNQLEASYQELEVSRGQQQLLAQELQDQQIELDRERTAKSKLLAALDEKIQSTRQQISDFVERENSLLTLLEELSREKLRKPAAAFSKMRGKLSLPVKARVTAHFGDSKGIQGVYWDGLQLTPKNVQDVTAFYDGEIVFADWLRGFGFLVIIDHGDGYLSLYGNNEWLAVTVGDWVERGEVISQVGPADGVRHRGLYFEVRKDGEPQNPLAWVNAR